MKAFLGFLLGQQLWAPEVISVSPMFAVKKFSLVLLLLLGFVVSGWAQGQVNFANNNATRILLEPCMSSNNCTFMSPGPNSHVAIYAAPGYNQPPSALVLQTTAITNLLTPGFFLGGVRNLSIPAGPATVQVRVWSGPYPSYDAAASAGIGDGYPMGSSHLLNITLTASPTPPPTLVGSGLNQIILNTPSRQPGYVRWGNSPTTRLYTNDCNGTIAPMSGAGAFRFGLYVGSFPSPASSLILAALATNSATGGQFGTLNPTSLSQWQPANRLTFQVRGWPVSAGATYEEALNSPVPVLLGTSDVGFFTPSIDTNTASAIFGTGPGQVSGFELHGLCPPVALRRMAPDGPLKITRMARDNTITWSNVIHTAGATATYRFSAASNVAGPYANWTSVTANTSQVTFTNPYSGPSLFFKVEWTDAPAPQPVGTWDYQAFDGAGAVMAAGVFTFTSNVPGTVTRNFSRLQISGPVNLHPSGAGTLEASSTGSSNIIEMYYGSEFRLRGQMVGDYYAGDWFGTDYLVFIPENPPPPGSPNATLHTGRFVARRRF